MDDGELIEAIEGQRQLMIAVATGGPRIDEVNPSYRETHAQVTSALLERGLKNPNPYNDLWKWYGKWSSGDLPTYQSRRLFITDLFAPLIEALQRPRAEGHPVRVAEPTGWSRVDRGLHAVRERLSSAEVEEQFQTVGLLCRETLISLAQAVYDRERHGPSAGANLSETDAAGMLGAFISTELASGSNEEARRHARAALSLAVALQHRRTATLIDAALCAEATTSVVNFVGIVGARTTGSSSPVAGARLRRADQLLFEKFLQQLPSNGSIAFIRQRNMAGFSFRRSGLSQLEEFEHNWDNAEHEFLDQELERLRRELFSCIDEYLTYLGTNTWPTHDGFSTVPPEWENTQPRRFSEVVEKLHGLAHTIVDLHARLIRCGRSKLGD